MKYVNKDDLPEYVLNNELPTEKNKKYMMYYNEKYRTSGGFADAIFLGAIMLVCFMWGMLAIALW